MIERELDFEDDEIRTWSARPEDQVAGEYERDPTVMSLDVEKEEVFESRTYRFTPSPEALDYLSTPLISQRHEFELGPEDIVQGAMELMKYASFKFLAKRRKEGGLVSSLLVGLALGGRRLLGREEWVEESEYRRTVRAFEDRFLGRGILNPPLVVTLEEWCRYFKKGPFRAVSSDELPGSLLRQEENKACHLAHWLFPCETPLRAFTPESGLTFPPLYATVRIDMYQHVSMPHSKAGYRRITDMLHQVVVKASEGHRAFGKLLKRVYRSDEHLIVERAGFPVAVMMSYQEYKGLMRERALAAHNGMVSELGKQAELQGLTEERLMAELEETKREVYREAYGQAPT